MAERVQIKWYWPYTSVPDPYSLSPSACVSGGTRNQVCEEVLDKPVAVPPSILKLSTEIKGNTHHGPLPYSLLGDQR